MILLCGIFSVFAAKALSDQSPSIEIGTTGNKGKSFRPFFNPERDIKFLLFTRRNPFVGQHILLWDSRTLFQSNFNISNPTRVLIHGWGSDRESSFNVGTTAAYLENNDFNVIIVDWSRGAQTINYVIAKNRVAPVGRVLGNFLDFLHDVDALRFHELTVVGFSLGAHVAGFAGKTARTGRINTIIGLDPAGPLFTARNPDGRLDASDAVYVEAIHTNGRVTGVGFPVGHADFFPNNGVHQPGCWTNVCHHDRATLFFMESINSNKFYAQRCNSVADFVRGCSGVSNTTMGGEPSNAGRSVRGIFNLTTNRSAPFAQVHMIKIYRCCCVYVRRQKKELRRITQKAFLEK